ncbi:hypothetical protein FOMG_15920 [Fusarium oxysporum f. sp. melonis 26406]|uniref:Uncharacterized protein n=1 Tax=Fusarium oxysporum f. sp. melonis 26406 TaxID=1089452 RepID=W9ZGK3_FUSOX|nr:hypothetical protein FOMG_15920 [Fusarium oxysporum f. sp. melonis 26406]
MSSLLIRYFEAYLAHMHNALSSIVLRHDMTIGLLRHRGDMYLAISKYEYT